VKVVLLEFIAEFDVFHSFVQKNQMKINDFTIVALEPTLCAYLQKRGIPFRDTLAYFTNDSHKHIIFETEKVMKIVRAEFKFEDSNGLRECYKENYAHYLRFIISHLFKLIEIICNIHKKHHNVEFWACVSRKISPSHLIGEDERYLGVLTERFCRSKEIGFFNLNEVVDSAGTMKCSNPEHAKRGPRILEKVFAFAMLNLLRRRKLILIPRIPRRGNSFNRLASKINSLDKEIIFVAIDHRWNLLKCAGYNFFSLLVSFFNKHRPTHYSINISHFNKKPKNEEMISLNRNIETVLRKISDDKPEFLGVNFSDLVTYKTKYGFKEYLENMLSDSHRLEFVMNKFNKQLVISYSARGLMSVAGELSGVAGKSSLFVSHGTHPVPVDEVHEIELYNLCKGFMLGTYTHIALSTPVQEKHLLYFKKKYPEIHNQTIKAEPLVFSQVNDFDRMASRNSIGLQDGEILLTHATSTKARGKERFHFIETLDEIFSSLSDIVKTVNAINGTKLLIKLHPGFPLSFEEINSLLPISDKVLICRDIPFATALAATDILISYSSTAIDEALINRIPVLLYDKWCRYNHFETSVYEETESGNLFPVCYVNNSENLDHAINYLRRKVTSIKRDEMDMRNYCYDDHADELPAFLADTLNSLRPFVR